MVYSGNRGFNAVYSEEDFGGEMVWNACRVSDNCGYPGGGVDVVIMVDRKRKVVWELRYE